VPGLIALTRTPPFRSGGYPRTIIRVEDCDVYLAALDRASIDMDIKPFAQFVAERVKWSMEPKKQSTR